MRICDRHRLNRRCSWPSADPQHHCREPRILLTQLLQPCLRRLTQPCYSTAADSRGMEWHWLKSHPDDMAYKLPLSRGNRQPVGSTQRSLIHSISRQQGICAEQVQPSRSRRRGPAAGQPTGTPTLETIRTGRLPRRRPSGRRRRTGSGRRRASGTGSGRRILGPVRSASVLAYSVILRLVALHLLCCMC